VLQWVQKQFNKNESKTGKDNFCCGLTIGAKTKITKIIIFVSVQNYTKTIRRAYHSVQIKESILTYQKCSYQTPPVF
jgi:hypothetical protein